MKKLFGFFLILCPFLALAQKTEIKHVLVGTVENEIFENVLKFEIEIEYFDTLKSLGTYSSNNRGEYFIELAPGKYKFFITPNKSKVTHYAVIEIPESDSTRYLKQMITLSPDGNDGGSLRIDNRFDHVFEEDEINDFPKAYEDYKVSFVDLDLVLKYCSPAAYTHFDTLILIKWGPFGFRRKFEIQPNETIHFEMLETGKYYAELRKGDHYVDYSYFDVFDEGKVEQSVCIDVGEEYAFPHEPFIELLENGQYLQINMASRGCFHFFEDSLRFIQRDDLIFAVYGDEEIELNEAQINDIASWERKLDAMEFGWCTTTDRYTLDYNGQRLFMQEDGTCRFAGFYGLLEILGLNEK